MYLKINEPPAKRNSLPVKLITNERASNPNTPSSPKGSKTDNHTLTTKGPSEINKVIAEKTPQKTLLPTHHSAEIQTPKLPTQSRRQQSNNGIKNLFTQTTQKTEHQIQQVNTQEADKLSPYEELLIQHMVVRPRLYDQFHQIMMQANLEEIGYEIKISLFANGAIRNAKISKKSSIKEIDTLAITSAYNASPFPRPPAKDISRNYQYTIPIFYQSKHQASKH